MKKFSMYQIMDAYKYSAEGGQALHVHSLTMGHPFFKRFSQIAHLFDQDRDRLVETARRLGVQKIRVEYEGTARQHIDLCGKPFDRAVAECEDE